MSTIPDYESFTEEELIYLKNEVLYCLRAYHNLPSEMVGDALMCNLYDKFAERFGLNPAEREDA